jgi:teichuronic acid exporter
MLREKAIKGAGWNAIQHFGRQGIRFVISIILARILLPEHYGVIGVLLVFIAISQTIMDSGLGQALIQKKNADYVDENTVFYTNIVLSVLMYIGLCLATPSIARFYDMPQLNALSRVLALQLVIQSFGLIHATILTKNIDFKKQTKITLTSVAISGAIGVIMAYRGFGIWSLVAQTLSGSMLNTIGLWLSHAWRPSLCFSFKSLKSLFGFGSKVLASDLINTFFRNIYTIIIGKMFSPADLGLYARGNSLVQLPVQILAVVVRRVTFPVFSSINDDKPRIKRGMQKILMIMFFINCPIMLGLAAVADNLVFVLLTEKWAACISYIRLLSIGGLLYPLHVVNLNALLSIGRSDLTLKLEIIKKFLIVCAIAITWQWGITGLIIGQICQSFAAYLINAYYSKEFFDYSYWSQVSDVVPYLLASLMMGLGVFLLGSMPVDSITLILCCQIVVGAAIYLGACYLFRLAAFREVIEIAKSFLIARRKQAVV